ncbi:DUF1385 domain-containing protein (plasmid) [Brevibacillus halotolerans]|nr:DUF1385 domain-containing protein [Brevibacillus halotolerans]
MIVDINGGRAHLNGVTFFTQDLSARAYRKKGEIVVSVKERKQNRKRFYDGIPFLRGILFPIELFILNPISLLYLIILGISSYSLKNSVFNIPQANYLVNTQIPIILIPFVIVLMLLIASIFIRGTKMGRYHAAEHMTANAYSKGLDLTVENVMKQSRVHEHCGTNFLVFLLTIAVVLMICGINGWISNIVSWSFSYELFRLRKGWMKIILSPFYWIGSFAQYTMFTSKPTELEVSVSIESLRELIRRDAVKKN